MKNISPVNDDKDIVTKGDIKTLQEELSNDIALNKSTLGTQRKNLLKNTGTSKTMYGVSFTVNDDMSVTANGTNNAQYNAIFIVFSDTLQPGRYILNGCPEGGGTVYQMRVGKGTGDGEWVGHDKGSGCSFTVSEAGNYTVMCQILPGQTADNVTFYPMLRYADIADDTYEQYKPGLIDRCLLKDTAGIYLGTEQSSSITIDNLSMYSALWANVSGNCSGINFQTNLIVPVAYLSKNSANGVLLAGGIPSSAYITSDGVLAAKNLDGTIAAKVNGNTLSLTIGTGTIGAIEVISVM